MMCRDQTCFYYLILLILLGSGVVIYAGLKYRKRFFAQNLKITAEHVWEGLRERIETAGFQKEDLLYSIQQDASFTVASLLVKNALSEVVTEVKFPFARREFQFSLGNNKYQIEFPLSWRRKARLISVQDGQVLATYKMLLFGKHHFEIPALDPLVSQRPLITLRLISNYYQKNQWVGTTQKISSRSEIGHAAVLPKNLSLPVKIFILIVG